MRSCPALEMCHSFLCCELGMPATAPLHLHTPFPHTTPPPLPPITRRCAWASLPAGSVLPFAERPAALQCLLQLHGLHSPVVTASAALLALSPWGYSTAQSKDESARPLCPQGACRHMAWRHMACVRSLSGVEAEVVRWCSACIRWERM